MEFTIYTANCMGNAGNCLYPNEVKISTKDDLVSAVAKDQVFASFKDNYRKNENFIRSNVVSMDCDNDHSEDPKDWLTAEKLVEIFGTVDMVLYPSRHHMISKKGKAPRPKYHVLFPTAEFTDFSRYTAVKAAVQRRYPFFDLKAIDAAHFFYGAPCKPEDITWNEGFMTIDETLEEDDYIAPDAEQNGCSGGAIYEGSRNNTMSRFAGRVLIKYGNCEKAYQIFRERADKCEPPLSERELQTIWNSAVKFAGKVQSQEGYVPPEEFNADFGDMKPGDYSDLGEAKVLCRDYGKELRFTKATDYLRHDGVCWREEPHLALDAAEEFLDLQLADAQDSVETAEKALTELGIDAETVKSRGKDLVKSIPADKLPLLYALISADTYLKFVMKYRNFKNITNFLSTAKPMLAMDISEFDTDPNLLNTPAGTYDLSQGMKGMHEHCYEDYITKVTNVSPGDVGYEIWQKAINIFFCGDQNLIDYVQTQVGMAAIGKVYQEHMIIAYGGGANGKSTFWNVIFRVLGSYAGKISAEALTINCKRNVKPEMAELKGKRLIIASEMEEGMRLNTATIKQLCSTDEIQAEKKYKDPFHFVPSHTLVLYTNHLPKVGANDDGIWRRLIVIPFNAKITGDSDIKNYADYLYDKAGCAIMKWIIEGAEKAIKTSYRTPMPKLVQDAIDQYRDSNDWLGQFIDEHCDIGASLQEKSGELYQCYRNACVQTGEYARSTGDFYGALEKTGFPRKKLESGKVVLGLKLKDGQDFLQ